MLFLRKVILMSATLLLVSVGKPDRPLNYLAYGDIRGYLEPCGCDPRSDLGGAKRMAAFLDRERAIHPDLLVFDLGNNVKFDNSLSQLKSPYVLEATVRFKPDAVLFNTLEQKYAKQVFGKLKEKKLSLPYVLTLPKVEGVATSIDTAMGVVFGFVGNSKTENRLELLRINVEKMRTMNKGRRFILLFSGTESELRSVYGFGLFDEIVSSSLKDMDYTPAGFERTNEGSLVALTMDSGEIRSVPVGGQGVLRGGGMTQSEAKPLGELFQPRTSPRADSPLFPDRQVLHYYSWLDSKHGGDDELKDIFARYQVATEAQFEAKANERLAGLKNSAYVGSDVCQGCHPTAFDAWQKSAHASAIKTLEDVAKSKDGECVSCHVVGADQPGGFVSMEHSSYLANVQCENCHGPRKGHIEDPRSSPETVLKSKDVCQTCHYPPHSTAFNFEEYWRKIAHGVEGKQSN